MRLIKDSYELSYIHKAGKIVSEAMKRTLNSIEVGVSETEVASEAYRVLYSLGSEEPKVYVNAGPYPRIHAELP